MSDIFNYWQPTVWSPPPYWAGPDPYAASNANMASNIAAQQSNQAAVNQASNTPVYTSPVGFGDYNYGTVQSYPSFGEAQNYGGQNDPFSGGYSPYQQSAPQQQPASGTTPAYVGGEWRAMQDLTPEQQYQWSQQNGIPMPPPDAGPSYWGGNNYPDIKGMVPPQPQQQYNPYGNFEDRWGDSGGQYAPPAARPGSGPDGGWERYFNDVTSQPPQPEPQAWRPAPGSWQERALGINWGSERDQLARQMQQIPQIPSQPTANQGYNPGMENWFANPGMNQFNPNIYQQQLEQILRGIDQGTGQQNLDPNWLVPGGAGPGGKSYDQSNNVGNSTAGG